MITTQDKKTAVSNIKLLYRSKRLIWNIKRRNSYIKPYKFIYQY
jgi:hypothetical protein